MATLGWGCRGREPEEPEKGYSPSVVTGAPGPPESSPNARLDVVASLREDLDSPRGPGDGGGRAWLEDPEPGRVGVPGRWTVIYEAGDEGIEPGGALFLQTSPFWGWSTPQVIEPGRPGFTEVSTEAEGLDLAARTVDRGLLALEIGGRALEGGERVRIAYGAGPAGSYPDRYAERRSPLWVAVDGDGDGIRKLLPEPLTIDVAPGPPARLSLIGPSTARPGEPFVLHLAALDEAGNAWTEFRGTVRLGSPEGVAAPAEISFRVPDRGVRTVEATARDEGIYRLTARSAGMEAESNPVSVSASGPDIAWADLHGHSQLSDGTATPEDYFRYARDVAGLDVVALTDHDHWGMRPLALSPDLWEEIRGETERFHQPGRFVTVLGYEWTNWIHGHRHVLYFDGQGEVLDSTLPEYETPTDLWDALRGRNALTFAHHSAGDPVATNWSFAPDPELEPVTEIVSVHGVSEARDARGVIHGAVPGNFVRDVLGLGFRLGFIGSGDTHDGHPGLGHLSSPTGGLAALLGEISTREGVRSALKTRRVYATSGPRIVLRTALAGRPMGSAVPVRDLTEDPASLWIEVLATAAIEALEVVRSGSVVGGLAPEEGKRPRDVQVVHELEDLRAGEYVYVRVTQEDGHSAWSSPFFLE